MDVLATNIDRMSLSMCQSLLCHIGAERQDKIRRYRQSGDALRSFFGELLVRVYAAQVWGIPHQDCHLQVDEYGKPYLVHYPRCQFNVSHSGDWIVAAFDATPVGVDIEKIVPIDISIADRFFSAEEVHQLERVPPAQRLQYFYRFWTLKETYIKAIGKGLSIPLNSFRFELTENTIRFHSDLESHPWRFRRYSIDPEYELAVCGYRVEAMFPNELAVITPQELLDRFERIAVVTP